MSEELPDYPTAARHCSCLAHRAGHPERHIAYDPEPEPKAGELPELLESLVGNPFLGSRR